MSRPLPKIARLLASAAAIAALAPAGAAAAPAVSPLPESNYAVRPACAAPAPGHAGCLAQQLIPVSAEALRHTHPLGMRAAVSPRGSGAPSPKSGLLGLRPQDIHSAYGIPDTGSEPQTIALVDAYDDPTAEADLRTYDEEFGLPECTKANGCFEKVGHTGLESKLPFPESTARLEAALAGSAEEAEEAEEAIGWGVEMSLDIETAHATCQSCRILLVESGEVEGEARTPEGPTSFVQLEKAEARAYELGATEISNSWGGPEGEAKVTVSHDEKGSFDRPGTVITASAGDYGYANWQLGRHEANYPASSPHVISVGGTRLLLEGGRRVAESVWNGAGASGGGCSAVFPAPEWQRQAADWASVGCAKRLSNDVSADADPYSGVVIRDTDDPGSECAIAYTEESGGKVLKRKLADWCTYGGTSLASPIVAGVFGLAGGAHGVSYPAQTLYENLANAPKTLHDVTAGSNGECAAGADSEGFSLCEPSAEAASSCGGTLACLAGPGYDGPSGVGTPEGLAGFEPGQHEGGSGEAHGEGGGSAGSGSGQAASAAAPAPAPATPAPVPPATAAAIQLSALQLTTLSIIALDQGAPTVSKVAFSFVLNRPVKVRITLARRVRRHGRLRWVTVGRASTISARAGRSARHLTERRRLAPGLYRLALAPAGGSTRSVRFWIY